MSDIYRELIIDHYRNPRNFGEIKDADLQGNEDNVVCGDAVTFYIKVRDTRVVEAKWNGSGCALSQASASLLSEMLKGKTLDQLRAIEDNDILKIVGTTLNPSRKKCATLSLEALKKTIQ